MKYPPPLSEGSRVAVVSPAGPVTPELLSDGLALLDSWNLDVDLHSEVYRTDDDRGYLAGSDRDRTRALQHALDSPEFDAVLFSRGGYGTMRVLPELSFEALHQSPKILVGFSDLTALHLYAAGLLDVATLHGPVVKSLRLHDRDSETIESLRGALFGQRHPPIVLDDLDVIRGGTARGRLLGGNLTLVASMLSSPYCPDLSDAILLLEETGEEDYRLDRLLTALRLSEKVGTPAALLLGDFTDCGGAYVRNDDIDAFLRTLGAEFECPVLADVPSGHEDRNVALPMGVPARVDADAGRVELLADVTGT